MRRAVGSRGSKKFELIWMSLMLCLVIVVLTLRFTVLVQNSECAGLVALRRLANRRHHRREVMGFGMRLAEAVDTGVNGSVSVPAAGIILSQSSLRSPYLSTLRAAMLSPMAPEPGLGARERSGRRSHHENIRRFASCSARALLHRARTIPALSTFPSEDGRDGVIPY
jgi:hypothetical protein